MEFQIYDTSANSLSSYFSNNSKSGHPSAVYNSNQYSLALDIMENDEYFLNWNSADAKTVDHHTTNASNSQQMMVALSANRKRKLLCPNNGDSADETNVSSVIVDDSSDNSVDSSLASGHDSVIKGPPAKLKPNNSNSVAADNQHLILGHQKMMMINGQQNKKALPGNGGPRMPHWQVEDIAELNADIAGSLNDHANHPAFNMSDAILSISGLTVFKQEAPSPTSTGNNDRHGAHDGNGRQLVPIQVVQCINGTPYGRPPSNDNNNNSVHNGGMYNNGGPQQLSGYNGNGQMSREPHSPNGIDGTSNGAGAPNQVQQPLNQLHLQDSYPSISSSTSSPAEDNGSPRDRQLFQYVLGAATSIATKLNEDPLTYLNQGQSYEIKLKALPPILLLGQSRAGKSLQSVIRVCFHERRLQYMEREQMLSWQRARPAGDRILDMDVPLSYGVSDVIQPSNQLNLVQFNWDPSKETGAYIKVNCISTEFTPKKHGGEKGVPFRIQVATYSNGNNGTEPVLLHAAACQVKVFKLKGADRKHKQDRDKVLKRPVIEQDKFQPSYDCTVLSEISSDAVVTCAPNEAIESLSCESYSRNGGQSMANTPIVPKVNPPVPEAKPQLPLTSSNINSRSLNSSVEKQQQEQPQLSSQITAKEDTENSRNQQQYVHQQLNANADPSLASRWLVANRFERYLPSFSNFCGADLLRMSRDDLMQVCGQADGIRLYNALHSKTIAPALTLYISRSRNAAYHALYLRSFSTNELQAKLSSILSLSGDCISAIYIQGPQGIHVHLEDAVLRHMKDDTMFSVVLLNSSGSAANFTILLKPESDSTAMNGGKGAAGSFDDRSN